MPGLVGYLLDDKQFQMAVLSFNILLGCEQILILKFMGKINMLTASHFFVDVKSEQNYLMSKCYLL